MGLKIRKDSICKEGHYDVTLKHRLKYKCIYDHYQKDWNLLLSF